MTFAIFGLYPPIKATMKFTAAFCILATGASAFGLQTPAKAAVRAAAKAPFMPAKQAKVPMVQPIDIDGVSCPPCMHHQRWIWRHHTREYVCVAHISCWSSGERSDTRE